MAVAIAESSLVNKSLVDEQLWQRLVNRIVKDEGMERGLAERIMNESLGFLRLCAIEPNGRYSPSPLVDIGWHTFILYTREYAAFCIKVAGMFIHHEPTEVEDATREMRGNANPIAVMRANGITVDAALWSNAADCAGHRCTHGDCTQSGPP